MSQARELRFESLEARTLLSAARHVVPHGKHAVVATALVLNGALTVNNKASTTSMDDQGNTTTSTPVAGQFGALGEIHGVWTTSSDQYGDYIGPDTLRLRGSNGSVIVSFNESAGRAHHLAGGTVQYSEPQRILSGTGAYARAKENGTIALTANTAHTAVGSMTLSTQSQ